MEHILTEESDHQALLVHAVETAPRRGQGGERQFRYEEAWTRHDQYESMIAEAWEAAGTGERGLAAAWDRLGSMAGSMQHWAREVFGSIRRQISKLKTQLLKAKNIALLTDTSLEVRELEEQLREIYAREEVMYRQRSPVDWL